jgi:hypothetical protein
MMVRWKDGRWKMERWKVGKMESWKDGTRAELGQGRVRTRNKAWGVHASFM